MRILVDTSLIVRCSDPKDKDHSVAVAALDHLQQQGHELRLVPQNIYEYWVVATRPVENNGLGFSPTTLQTNVQAFIALFPLLRDERTIFQHWQQLVTTHEVRGKPAHDTRLVAAMKRHSITHLLTFNAADFKRYAEITIETFDRHVSDHLGYSLYTFSLHWIIF